MKKLLVFSVLLTLGSAFPASAANDGYTFTTLVGRNNVGNVDGVGAAAQFNEPAGIAADKDGNLYVIDVQSQTLRKISPNAEVTTVAGFASTYGSTDGVGSEARFGFPSGVAVGSDGSVYVADTGLHSIRKVTPDNFVRTIAGGRAGSLDGLGQGASFNRPVGLAIDTAGNVYVADSKNHTIRKISPDGIVTTFAGQAGVAGSSNGSVAEARFNEPKGIAIDNNGNFYVADALNHVIRKITPAGVVTTLAGTVGASGAVGGVGSQARFAEPCGIAVDGAGNVHVVDRSGFLRKITPDGNATLPVSGFYLPRGVTVDAVSGNIFVADTGRRLIKKVTPGGAVTVFAGNDNPVGSLDGIGTNAQFRNPRGLVFDASGNLFVADSNSAAIRRVTPALFVTMWAGNFINARYGAIDGQGTAAALANPSGLAVDSGGNLYVADSNSTIRKIGPTGYVSTIAGVHQVNGSADGPLAVARFNAPRGIAVDDGGNIYVADSFNHTIRKIDKAGNVSTPFGAVGLYGATDGVGTDARFSVPSALAFDAEGNLYVADSTNYSVRKISPAGMVTTLAGDHKRSGSIDGKGREAAFGEIRGIAVDRDGTIFVTENTKHTIRKITPDGTVTTIGGLPGVPGVADGTGSAARFNEPWGITLDAFGHLYVSDAQNNTIRKGMLPGGKAPSFTMQPASLTVGAGREAIFSVAAGGPPAPLYQWQRRAAGAADFVALTDGSGISGAMTATLRISTTIAMSQDEFRCVADNGISPLAISTPAVLTVIPPPTFTSAGTATFTVGVPGSFTVRAAGATAFNVSSGTLPSWLAFDTKTGVLTGTPADTTGAPYPLIIEATNSAVATASQSLTLNVSPGPAFISHPTAQTVNAGVTAVLFADVAGVSPISVEWRKNGVAVANSARISGASTTILAIGKAEVSDAGAYTLVATSASGNATSDSAMLTVVAPPTIARQPESQTAAVGSQVAFSVTASSATPLSFQWLFNGQPIPGATASIYSIASAHPNWVGEYSVRVYDAVTSILSRPAYLNIATTAKAFGAGVELGPDIMHPLGRIYDQAILTGSAATFTADADQVLRVSCIDENDDIVQIEFSGAGTLHIRLDAATGPAAPTRYNQTIEYMKGRPVITIAGANETTNITVFTVGRITALNQLLFHDGVVYDGIADITSIAIGSTNGKFGGVYTGNAHYHSTRGFTGIYAPGVQFSGPVVVGNIRAADTARAGLLLGAASDVRVAGGDLRQTNRRPVEVDGFEKLSFTPGATSHGVERAALTNQARLERNGIDVTTAVQ